MDKEELARRIGVERADWKFFGGRSNDGAGEPLKAKVGVQVWDGTWCDGGRFALRVPGHVSDDEWETIIAAMRQKVAAR